VEKGQKEEKRRTGVALKMAKAVARTLKKKYRPEDVILFGSLIWRPEFLWAGTDIDLIAKGLEDERYFEILPDISAISHPFRVDLLPFEKAWPRIKSRP